MAVERQRFCPVCDRLFNEGEAVLRCAACHVQHHPGCWVRNNGCATDAPHNATPQPEAYGVAPRPVAVAAEPVPVPRPASTPRPAPVAVPDRITVPAASDEFVIGRTAPARSARVIEPPPPPVPVDRPRAKAGRYPDLSSNGKTKPMPSIYPGHRLLRFWYVPVAGALAVVVALGVVFATDRLFSGDNENASAAPDDTPTLAAGADDDGTPTPATSSTPNTQVTVVPTEFADDPTPPPSGSFSAGSGAVVANTDGCLNVRVGPGLANDAIVCLPDGTQVTVLGGPTTADDFTWWQVETPQGTGWAVVDYLAVE